MPDNRSHRGPHPEDEQLFAPAALPTLREAGADLAWLLTRGYSLDAALELVGNRFQLRRRQRTALMRSVASDQALASRRARELAPDEVSGRHLWVDGFNLVMTLESALSGAIVLVGRDGCARDLASVHGSYRKVEETAPAIALAGDVLAPLAPAQVTWLLDAPVSNSGRLKTMLREHAEARGLPWEIALEPHVDATLKTKRQDGVVTADGVILDACCAWFDLARHCVARLSDPWVVAFFGAP
ncbi:MAG: DUF434 domain-containing protein [Myxococcales bacterium]|nr:DUF434 domain-containing protein [Myxococcales bacterium]MCB9732749.1 DUF434 domain-containing protein [Deltaproteobacteria bacterium]